jgi:hypothetical protein
VCFEAQSGGGDPRLLTHLSGVSVLVAIRYCLEICSHEHGTQAGPARTGQ